MSVSGTLICIGILGFVAYKHWPNLKTVKEKKQIVAVLTVITMFGYLIGSGRETKADDHFRDQFLLPENAEIVEMNMPHEGIPSRAVYRIPDSDWQQFIANLNTAPTPFRFGFSGDPVRHAQIARWQDSPRAYHFTMDHQVKNGKTLCIAYIAQSSAGARACKNKTRNDPLYAFAFGVIDFDQKLVRMHVNDNSGGFRLY